jgi:hypothetical protein
MALPLTILLGVLSLAAGDPVVPPPVPAEPSFLFDLATSTGASESTWASVAYDRKHDELFTIHGGLVHIYNQAGMRTFTFGGDGDLGTVERLALFDSGEMLLLTNLNGRRTILRCDYRGELIGTFEPKPLPEAFVKFDPDRILIADGKVYLVESVSMRVVVTDGDGKVEATHDLAALLRKKEADIKTGMNGFWVDRQGNFVFTLPYAFTAFVMSPEGVLRQFGSRGSSPGKFNIVGAVAVDEKGWLFVLDRLRSVVIVFDPALKFVFEFGYRGDGPTNLIAPYDLAVGNGKIFVSQARDRGVKVFQYDFSKPAPPPPLGAKRG